MDYERLTAREAIDLLAAGLTVARGSVRITASFKDGTLIGPAEVHVFRLPPAAMHTIPGNPRIVNVELLEHIAEELHLNEGATKLVVEYVEQEGKLSPHWIDFAWEVPR